MPLNKAGDPGEAGQNEKLMSETCSTGEVHETLRQRRNGSTSLKNSRERPGWRPRFEKWHLASG